MSSNIQIIDPTTYPDWDKLLLTNPESSFFHTSAWANVLNNSYGYKPLYFARIENKELKDLLAVMEVDSFLTGKRGVSLPFTDDCPVIAESRVRFDKLFSLATDYGKRNKWKTLEIRGGQNFLKDVYPDKTFLTHKLELVPDENILLSKFRSSTRRNIKKAEKNNVVVETLYNKRAIDAFYHLNCLTRKDHGLPPQPLSFFENLYDTIIAHKKGIVMLAKIGERIIAGSVYLLFGDRAIYKYGASNKQFQIYRANNLVMWEAIKQFADTGYKYLDFGRTELEHEGLRRFKLAWGTVEVNYAYFKYDIGKGAFVSGMPKAKSYYNVFNHMPILLLKLIGKVLYKHVG